MRLLPLALAVLAAPALAQTTWYVDAAATPPGNGSQAAPFVSLQDAIAQPATVGGDRIEVAPGTYAEPFDFLGKAIHVVSTSGPAVTILDGESYAGDRSVVRFESGEGRDSVLEGFSVTNGTGTYDTVTNFVTGGGVRMVDSSPTIKGCWITGNTSGIGGGVYGSNASPHLVDTLVVDNAWDASPNWGTGVAIEGGVVELDRVRIEGNFGLDDGAGLWLKGVRATLRGCEVVDNASSYGNGGGLYAVASEVLLQRCRIADNVAFDGGNGGGLVVASGSRVTAVRCVVEGNVADTDHLAGGILVAGGGRLDFRSGSILSNYSAGGGGMNVLAGGQARVSDSVIADNTSQAFQSWSGHGGGVLGPARLYRCLIEGNRAIEGAGSYGGQGGGVWGASLMQCTVTGNTATGLGGGVYGSPRIANSIVWGNTPAILGGTSAGTYSDVEGGLAGTGNLSVDPLFTDPAGGDFTLQPASPCIDAGDPASPPDPDGTRADMGAFPYFQAPGFQAPRPRR